ncbi:SDR family oxidoreductase [Longispora albida]|uniref:SDR family oxidoreductase n=1 Tax=Longispora albida TaxID=203523 RepID=UPI00035DB7AC|nr:sugar nucleotide-binding protein [Longispora albida]
MKMLITGASGFLGSRVARLAVAAGYRVTGCYATSPADVPGAEWRRLDILDEAAVAAVMAEVRPDAVVHTAFVQSSWPVIVDGTASVAKACGPSRLVHVSSDAVFGGRAEAYTEKDLPSPVNPYGAAKAAAEAVVRALRPEAAIVRNSLIIGDGDSSHERVIRSVAAGQGILFTEELRSPIHVTDLTAAVLELATMDYSGVLNVAGPEAMSRYELGVALAPRLGIDPAALKGGPAPFACPGEVVLDTSRARALLRTRLRGVSELV